MVSESRPDGTIQYSENPQKIPTFFRWIFEARSGELCGRIKERFRFLVT